MSAEIRFIAKVWNPGDTKAKQRWGVYDRKMGSWPIQRPGLGKVAQPGTLTEAEAQAEAERLDGHYRGGGK